MEVRGSEGGLLLFFFRLDLGMSGGWVCLCVCLCGCMHVVMNVSMYVSYVSKLGFKRRL